jgi:hypothetical protein
VRVRQVAASGLWLGHVGGAMSCLGSCAAKLAAVLQPRDVRSTMLGLRSCAAAWPTRYHGTESSV